MPLRFKQLIPCYILVFSAALFLAIITNRTVTTLSQADDSHTTIILDAGHGGEDGGAISCTGAKEADINLQITLRLNDLLHLLGYRTKMVRTDDSDLHAEGSTISQRKNSDLRQRVSLINDTPNSFLISIHQNQFSDSRYSGAQTFWAATDGSKELAEALQTAFVSSINYGSKRIAKKATGIYIMDNIICPGVLVECGFLSNCAEEEKLRSSQYQKNICCVIASGLSEYLDHLASD